MNLFSTCRAALLVIVLTSCSAFELENQNTRPSEKTPVSLATEEAQTDVAGLFSQAELAALLDELILVEGGSFMMGSPLAGAAPREQPVHRVDLDTFYIGKTEVTQSLYTRVMGGHFSYFQCEICPVNNISWSNIQQFIERLNAMTGKSFRLPTEAEWEYAARGGQQSQGYIFSGSNSIDEIAWYAENASRRSHPVAQKKPNELGLYDMTGNLWEFCQDDMDAKAYRYHQTINPLFDNGRGADKVSMKVIRGGGYEFAANESDVYKRDGATSNVRMPDIGFRLVMSHR